MKSRHSCLIALYLLSTACGKSDPVDTGASVSFSADKPAKILGMINTAVKVAGASLNTAGGIGGSGFVSLGPISSVEQECDLHAAPSNPTTGAALSSSDPDYPGRLIYCKLAKNTNSPESIQGSFTFVRQVLCALENAGTDGGFVYDGAAHTVLLKVDDKCFDSGTQTTLGSLTVSISFIGSKPASFNSYFAAGIIMQIPSYATYSIGTKLTENVIEFALKEDLTGAAGGTPGTYNKSGGYAGALDLASGDFHFEGRSDRYAGTGAGCTGGACGWSRHDRISANFTMSSGAPTGLVNLSDATSQAYAIPASGSLDTVSGTFTSGLKARHFKATDGAGGVATTSDLGNPKHYIESINTKCYTSSSSSGAGCDAGIAISASATFPFMLLGTFTPATTWLTNYTGMRFTAVDPNLDIQN